MLKTLAKSIFVVACLSLAIQAKAAGKEPIQMTLGWQPTMNGARFFVAEGQDLFKKEGLDVKLVRFNAGPPFFAAFQSGSIDVGFMGIQPAVTAIAQGIPVKVCAIENDAGGAEGLVARKDSGITNLKDMKGKKIATRRGSSAHTALLTGLQKAGLTVDDIQLVDLDVSALIPAFEKGDIQAAWYWEPWMGLLKRKGGVVVAVDKDIDMPSGILWVGRKEWLDKNQEAMQRLLRVLDLAAEIIKKDPKEAAALVAKRLELTDEHVYEVLTKGATWPTNAESMKSNYPFSMSSEAISSGKGIVDVMKSNADFQKKANIIQTVPDFAHAIDNGPLTKYVKK
jgi:aliphatic sulfonates family ABC transporter substrate-binding protein